MPPTLEHKIEEVKENFSALLNQVTSREPATLYQAESALFSAVLALGKQLLELFFFTQIQALNTGPLHSYKKRVLVTVFGRLDLRLPYYSDGEQPLDEALALPARKHSDLLCQMSEHLGASLSYGKSLGFLEHFFGVCFSPDTLSAMMRRDAEAVEIFYEEASPALEDEEAELLVVQADGKGVPLRCNEEGDLKKKEAVVTGIYTISPRRGTPEAIVAALFDDQGLDDQGDKILRPMNKRLWASLDGKAAALDRLQEQGRDAEVKLALCDGAQALQEGIQARFEDYTMILDIVHVKDHLWKLGAAICHWTQRRAWVKARLLELLKEPPEIVIDRIEAEIQTKKLSAEQAVAAHAELGYLRRNQSRIDYALYLDQGWPIATGVIEGACKHLVKARCEAGGMRWSKEGAGAVLGLRAVMINGHWEPYHRFRRARNYEERFGKPLPEEKPLEWKPLMKRAA